MCVCVCKVCETYITILQTLTPLTPSQQPDQSAPDIPASERNMRNRKAEDGYFRISRHFKWALTQTFDVMNYENVIIVEGEYLSDRLDQL